MDLKDLTHPLKVVRKIDETIDTQSLVLEVPAELKEKFKFKAGQFVTFFMNIQGEDIRRSYSIASSPEMDSDLKVTVKRVSGGKGSNYLLDEVKEGDTLNTTPPAGLFVLPKQSKKKHVFFAAGSGITPIISLIKTALSSISDSECHLLYANRDENCIIFHRELKSLNEKFHQRFRYEYILSQPKKPFSGLTGRLHGPQVKKFVEDSAVGTDAYFFLCGPDGFMSTIESALEIHGVPRENIVKESFYIAPKIANPATGECKTVASASTSVGDSGYLADLKGAVLIGDTSLAEKPQQLHVELDGEVIEIKAKEGQSVLETLLEAGYNPPYSCMDGACMACMGKVKEGLVYQEDMGILTEDNTEVGECLTCQAKPASKKVSVSYEL